MKQILVAALLILLMSGTALAEQVEEWPFGQRNEIPEDIEGVRYDFEEGSNCVDFKNQYPEVATFLTVLGTQPYGTSDWPSYVTVGGSSCGLGGRCYMKIYPWCGYYPNGTPYEWVFIVQGDTAFSPMTGPDSMGGYIPGTRSHLVFKEDTRYVSFLACTGGNMYVDLYDRRGDRICSEKITITIYRDGTDPSNFTQFSFYSQDTDIVSMKIRGPFNGHHIDDLVIGGEPGYLPKDYSYAAERMKELIGAPYLEHGLGYNLMLRTYHTAEAIKNEELPYVDLDTKSSEIEYGVGIDDEGAILWAFNEHDDVINWYESNDKLKHDFSEHVDYEDIKAGDVGFIDYPEYNELTGEYGPGDGIIDETFIVIDPTVDSTGDMVDCIRIIPEAGVHYSTTEFINALYDTGTSFVDYRRLPENPKGGHSPYPKIPTKQWI